MIEHWILEAFREELWGAGVPPNWVKVDCEWCGAKCVTPPPDIYDQLVKNIHYMCNQCKQFGRDLEAIEEADNGDTHALGA